MNTINQFFLMKINYGFHGHIVINSTGVITGGIFIAAKIDERDV